MSVCRDNHNLTTKYLNYYINIMDIKEIRFDSVKSFLQYLSEQDNSVIRLFRGQKEDWVLIVSF